MSQPPAFSDRVSSLIHWTGCFLTAAILSGRLFFPSEDAYRGTGLTFVLLGLLAGCLGTANLALKKRGLHVWLLEILWLLFLGSLWVSVAWHPADFDGRMLAWEWTAIFGVWLFVRSAGPAAARPPLLALLVAFALAQSLSAFWQLAVEFPELRQMVASRDSQVLEQLRQIGVEPGKVSEYRFQARLDANEASGTFGHPNSLAGFLVLCLPIAAGAAWCAGRYRRVGMAALLGIVTALLIAGVLTTKSSSAVVATVLIFAGVIVAGFRRRLLGSGMGRLAAAVVGFAMLAGAAYALWMVGAAEVDSLPGSLRSLRFRMEWWQGSAGVIRENALLGVGMGNFGSHYLMYKPPFSSEEIRDPHNFLIELWAGAGLVAMSVYLALLVAGSYATAGQSIIEPQPPAQPVHWWNWYLGAIAGLLLAAVTQVTGPAVLSLLFNDAAWFWVAGLVTAWPCRDVFTPSRQLALASLAGVLGLHLHLLVSGGIQYPALTLCCWSLLACCVPDRASAQLSQGYRRVGALAAATMLLVTAAFLVTLHLPMQSRQRIYSQMLAANSWQARGRLLEEYAQVFPNDAQGWEQTAGFYGAVLEIEQTSGHDRAYQQAVAAWEKAIAVQPRRASYHRELGKLRLQAWLLSLEPQGLAKAHESFQAMIGCYPNSAANQWEAGYAALLEQSQGKLSRAKQTAAVRGFFKLTTQRESVLPGTFVEILAPAMNPAASQRLQDALFLDQTPHIDKKLFDRQRAFARDLLERTSQRS